MNAGVNLYDKRIYFKNWVGVALAFLFYEQKLATPTSCLDESGLSLPASIQIGLQKQGCFH